MENRKLKVVFGVNDFLVGGMQRQFVEQMKYFDRNEFEIVLITLFSFPGQPALYDELPSDLEIHRLAFSSTTDIRNWFALLALLRKIRPDVVVSSLFISNTVFRVLKPFVGYRSIAREHNTYTDKPLLHQSVDRMLGHFSYRIVAVSGTVADFTAKQEKIPRSKFLVIRNGVDVEGMEKRLATLPPANELQQAMGFSSADSVCLNIARLVPQKNHRLLIDGFMLFRAKHPSSKLAIISGGALRTELEEYVASRKAGKDIIFFGYRDDFWKFYTFARALISTSFIEGLSNAMLEALAAGVPIVSTRTAGTDELLHEGENGFFIRDYSAESVCESLEKLIQADRVHLEEGARATAQEFDIKGTVHAYESLFRGMSRPQNP